MLHYFINLPSVWAYRSPQRNKYCRGPILAYWPRKLPAHEFLFERKGKGREPRSVNLFLSLLERLCGVFLFGSTKPSTAVNCVAELIHSRLHFFLLSKSAPVSECSRRHVGKFLQSPVANIIDAPRLSTCRCSKPPQSRPTAFFRHFSGAHRR